jgi:hypothetical protein
MARSTSVKIWLFVLAKKNSNFSTATHPLDGYQGQQKSTHCKGSMTQLIWVLKSSLNDEQTINQFSSFLCIVNSGHYEEPRCSEVISV